MIIEAVLVLHKGKLMASLPQSNGGCPGKLFFKPSNSLFDFNNPQKLDIKEKMIVQLDLPSKQTALTLFLLFLLPLGAFIITSLFIYKTACESTRSYLMVLPWLMLLLSYVIVYIIKRIFPSHFKPTLLSILPDKTTPCNFLNSCDGCHYNKK